MQEFESARPDTVEPMNLHRFKGHHQSTFTFTLPGYRYVHPNNRGEPGYRLAREERDQQLCAATVLCVEQPLVARRLPTDRVCAVTAPGARPRSRRRLGSTTRYGSPRR